LALTSRQNPPRVFARQLFLLLRRECLRRHPEAVISSAAQLYVIDGTVRACQ
jgi:hypothetical protein